MKLVKTFLTEREALAHIDRHHAHDTMIIQRDILSGRYELLNVEEDDQ